MVSVITVLTGSTGVLRPNKGSAHQEHALSKGYGFSALGRARGKHNHAHCEHNYSRNEPLSTDCYTITECLQGSLGIQPSLKFYKLKNTYSKPILG